MNETQQESLTDGQFGGIWMSVNRQANQLAVLLFHQIAESRIAQHHQPRDATALFFDFAARRPNRSIPNAILFVCTM